MFRADQQFTVSHRVLRVMPSSEVARRFYLPAAAIRYWMGGGTEAMSKIAFLIPILDRHHPANLGIKMSIIADDCTVLTLSRIIKYICIGKVYRYTLHIGKLLHTAINQIYP